MGLVPLDEGVFQHKGLKLTPGDNDVEVAHLIHHGGHLGQVIPVKIAADTVFQFFGLADIDNLAVLVQHDVHAGQQREAVCLVGQGIKYGIGHDFILPVFPVRKYSKR